MNVLVRWSLIPKYLYMQYSDPLYNVTDLNVTMFGQIQSTDSSVQCASGNSEAADAVAAKPTTVYRMIIMVGYRMDSMVDLNRPGADVKMSIGRYELSGLQHKGIENRACNNNDWRPIRVILSNPKQLGSHRVNTGQHLFLVILPSANEHDPNKVTYRYGCFS